MSTRTDFQRLGPLPYVPHLLNLTARLARIVLMNCTSHQRKLPRLWMERHLIDFWFANKLRFTHALSWSEVVQSPKKPGRSHDIMIGNMHVPERKCHSVYAAARNPCSPLGCKLASHCCYPSTDLRAQGITVLSGCQAVFADLDKKYIKVKRITPGASGTLLFVQTIKVQCAPISLDTNSTPTARIEEPVVRVTE